MGRFRDGCGYANIDVPSSKQLDRRVIDFTLSLFSKIPGGLATFVCFFDFVQGATCGTFRAPAPGVWFRTSNAAVPSVGVCAMCHALWEALENKLEEVRQEIQQKSQAQKRVSRQRDKTGLVSLFRCLGG